MPAAGVSQATLNIFMGNVYPDELSNMLGRNADPISIEQIANDVVNSVTKETITKQKKLIADPLLRYNWMFGMCKELGILAQGYGKEETIYYVKGA